ncbi:hypothetical protein FRUB_05086 [Fimbriiglobus ruber]|uniref:Uncharacterized protein n=1 Tax=Fimbriiglobus ruber TaxID=1908690 RepID=A0A225DVF9_9BACT|nr:hypothetical protein FRUB_05086 [Fimbriiglobus ruber]
MAGIIQTMFPVRAPSNQPTDAGSISQSANNPTRRIEILRTAVNRTHVRFAKEKPIRITGLSTLLPHRFA